MASDYRGYFIEEENGEFYVYDDYDELVYIASSIQSLNDFCPGLGDFQERIEMSKKKKPVSRKAWDHDKHLEEACKLYRQSAGWGEDEQLTEAHFKHEDWRLKNIGIKTGVHSSKLKEALLNQRTQSK